jgi:hypothetical protein
MIVIRDVWCSVLYQPVSSTANEDRSIIDDILEWLDGEDVSADSWIIRHFVLYSTTLTFLQMSVLFLLLVNLQNGSPAPTPTMPPQFWSPPIMPESPAPTTYSHIVDGVWEGEWEGVWPTSSPTVSHAPTSSAEPSICIGNTVDWVDIAGDGCDWYEAVDLPGCPNFGSSYEGDMGVANDNCCYCAGTGVSVTAL